MPARFESNSAQTLSGMRFTVRMGRRPRLSKLVISSVSWRLFEGQGISHKKAQNSQKLFVNFVPFCGSFFPAKGGVQYSDGANGPITHSHGCCFGACRFFARAWTETAIQAWP